MADILIKGMEMPTKCLDCPFSTCGDCDVANDFGDDRPMECPLIELKPHGRLIDADEFKSYLLESLIQFVSHPNYLEAKEMVEDFFKDIDAEPTVLEASK